MHRQLIPRWGRFSVSPMWPCAVGTPSGVLRETCQREDRLFFAREVNDEVLAYIRNKPDMGDRVRVGDIVSETKTPFLPAG